MYNTIRKKCLVLLWFLPTKVFRDCKSKLVERKYNPINHLCVILKQRSIPLYNSALMATGEASLIAIAERFT